MFDSLDPDAKLAMKAAIQEADARSVRLIAPPYLLLGLLRSNSFPPEGLRKLGNEPDVLIRDVAGHLDSREEQTSDSSLVLLTASSQEVLKVALQLATRAGASMVGVNQLLQALVQRPDPWMSKIWGVLRVDPAAIAVGPEAGRGGLDPHAPTLPGNAKPFERLGHRARNLIGASKGLADNRGSLEIDLVHFLSLALSDPRSALSQAAGLLVPDVRGSIANLERLLPHESKPLDPSRRTPMSPPLKAALPRAAALADEAGDPKIDSMHLLISILTTDHPAASLLADSGLTLFTAREAGVLLEDQEVVLEEFESRAADSWLKSMVKMNFECDVQHVGSESVSPSPEVLEICDGVVEIYQLIGHPQYERCFAWFKTRIREGRPSTKVFTVPQRKGVETAAAAIEATLAGRRLG